MKPSIVVGAVAAFLHGASAELAKDREAVLGSVKGYMDGLCIAPDKQQDSLDKEQACRCADLSGDDHGVDFFSLASTLAMVQSPEHNGCWRDFYHSFGKAYCGASPLTEPYRDMQVYRMSDEQTKPKC